MSVTYDFVVSDDFEKAEEAFQNKLHDELTSRVYCKYAVPDDLRFEPSNETERRALFINICQRFTKLELDYSVPPEVKKLLQTNIKNEMEQLMKSKKKIKQV